MKPFTIFIFLFLVLMLPSLVFAEQPSLWPTGYWGPILSCTGKYVGGSDLPPCTSLCNVFETIRNAIYFGLSLIIFVLAPIMFLAGGIMVVLGGANPGIINRGKSILWGTLWGVVIALGSFVIIATFLWLVGNKSVGGVPWPQINCSNPPGYQVDPSGFRSGYPPISAPAPTSPASPQECNLICPPNQECRFVGNNGVQACVLKTAPQQPAPQTCDLLKPAGQQGCPAGKSCVLNTSTGEISCK